MGNLFLEEGMLLKRHFPGDKSNNFFLTPIRAQTP